ncbi:hypothetical protein C8R46DRAFT_1217963 [Mycena filopes]|nr:hypothetical protein C8R46DRAFT_1217963 [Mycena filopes]
MSTFAYYSNSDWAPPPPPYILEMETMLVPPQHTRQTTTTPPSGGGCTARLATPGFSTAHQEQARWLDPRAARITPAQRRAHAESRRCGGLTKKYEQCNNNPGGYYSYCWLHRGQGEEERARQERVHRETSWRGEQFPQYEQPHWQGTHQAEAFSPGRSPAPRFEYAPVVEVNQKVQTVRGYPEALCLALTIAFWAVWLLCDCAAAHSA